MWAAVTTEDVGGLQWGDELADAYDNALLASGGSVYDTATGTRHDVRQTRFGDEEFSAQLPVVDRVAHDGGERRDAVEGRRQQHGHDGRTGRPLHRRTPPAGWSGRRLPYTAGLVEGSRRLLLETRNPSSDLLAVDLRTGTTQRLRLDLTPVRVDLLGWIDRRHALAQVQKGDEAHLTVLDLSGPDVTSNLAATIETAGTDSTFSFATDLASVAHPTRDFSGTDDGGSVDTDAPLPGAGSGGPDPAWLLAGLAAGLSAAALAVVLRRRIRVG